LSPPKLRLSPTGVVRQAVPQRVNLLIEDGEGSLRR